LFSTNGFHNASVRAITREADANLGAVTYHFGSKQDLYLAVLEQLFAALSARVTAAAAVPGPTAERIGAIVHALFVSFDEYPEAPRIVLHELARRGMPPDVVVPHIRRVIEAITTVVRDGQARGELRAVEPLLAAFSLMSQSIWFAVVRHSLARIAPSPFHHPDAPTVVERHSPQLVTRGLAPHGERL